MSITFKLDGVQDALNKLAKAGGDIADEVDMELADGANLIRKTAIQNVEKNISATTGKLKGDMYAEKIGPLRYEVGNYVFYAPYIEFGTGGKVRVPEPLREVAAKVKSTQEKRGNFESMVGAIFEWGVRKGYLSKNDPKARQRARWWAIRILKNGIDPQPFLYPAFVASRKKIVERIRAVVNEKR
jgi:HK97 gp10 family phage protein